MTQHFTVLLPPPSKKILKHPSSPANVPPVSAGGNGSDGGVRGSSSVIASMYRSLLGECLLFACVVFVCCVGVFTCLFMIYSSNVLN